MIYYVKGKDVKLEAYKLDGYYPFACAEEVIFELVEDFDVTTTPDSGRHRTFKPQGLATSTIQLKMITVLNNADATYWYSWEMALETIRNNGLNLKLTFTDINGLAKWITCFAYPQKLNMGGNAAETISRSNVFFQVSGGINWDSLITPNVAKVKRLRWIIAVAGQKEVQDNYLIGQTLDKIVEVSKEGDDVFDPVLGAPANDKQVQLDNVLGKLKWAYEFEVGDLIFCLVSN